MIAVRRLLLIVSFISIVSAGSAFGSATNVYVTPSGSAVGSCPAGTTSAPNLVAGSSSSGGVNNSSAWGAGTGQIGPGTTVLVCGTSTVATNGIGIKVQNSGTSSSPIVINFDTGAVLQSAAFAGNPSAGSPGGGIYINGYSYITINGQNTGTIQNTSNGSPGQTACVVGTCTVSNPSVGIWIQSTTGVTVENVTIQKIYMDLDAEQTGGQTGAAWNSADIWAGGPNTSLLITGNILEDSHVGVWAGFDNGSMPNLSITKNTIAHHAWQISWANGSSSSNSSSGSVNGNDISNWNDWNGGGSSSFHTDGIIDYTVSGAPTFNPQIYNNYFHGDLDGGTGAGTAHIACGSSGSLAGICTVFNNVIDMSSTSHCAGAIAPQGTGGAFYNNTIIGPSSCSTGDSVGFAFFGGSSPVTIENNILISLQYPYWTANGYNPSTVISASDYNVFYEGQTFAFSNTYTSVSAWSGTSGFDTHSVNTNPNVNSSTYLLSSGSSAIGLSANLYSLNIATLDSDKAGNSRLVLGNSCAPTPGTAGCWDAGSYRGGGLIPPTGLVATVH